MTIQILWITVHLIGLELTYFLKLFLRTCYDLITRFF